MRVENEDGQHLIVADEQLLSLEDTVRVMPTAQYLNVAFNSLSSLSGLEQMKELRSLDISHNAVESLQEVVMLKKLLVLKCSSNQITDLSWVTGLNNLEELWVRDNRIESAQIAHLQQLTALETLVIHPNPCTERDDYALAILNVLPWLQRVDTVVVTEELRTEARHAEERGALDSGATDCSLFSLSGRADDPASNEDPPQTSVPTPLVLPIKPPKAKKQMTAEEFMRAFPVQDFIPLGCNGDSVAVLSNQLSEVENGVTQTEKLNTSAITQLETVDNQHEMREAEHSRNSEGNTLQSEHRPSEDQPHPNEKSGTKTTGISALLDSVLTLPTFDNDSFLKKKKSLPGNGKPKRRVKPKTTAVPVNGRAESTLPFRQGEEYSISYPNSTVVAVQVRCDGSAIARWPSGSVAISVDFESSADRSGYRVYAAHKDGQLALSFDPAGVGFLNAYPSGKTLLSTTSDGNGLLFDARNGVILRQWDAQGKLRDGTLQQTDELGDEPDGSLLCRLSESLAVRVQLTRLAQPTRPESANNMKQGAVPRHNPISLHIYYAGAPGFRHVFVNSFNRAERYSLGACDHALGRASSKEEKTRTVKVKVKPTSVEHIDLLSSIRAAVAGL